MAARVYITGAAGTGCSSLGRALAERLGVPHFDTDDYDWLPSEPPFTEKRPKAERLALLETDLAAHPGDGWVISGSADGWGYAVLAEASLIVFLRAPMPVRLARIRRREAERFGDRIKPGGDMALVHKQFLDWAASYEDAYSRGRSLIRHRAWLDAQPVPVLVQSGTAPVEDLLAEITARL